jgi:hypothetical protein
MDKNIMSLGNEAHDRITKGEKEISRDYKYGNIDLPEARLKMMGLLQKEIDNDLKFVDNVIRDYWELI